MLVIFLIGSSPNRSPSTLGCRPLVVSPFISFGHVQLPSSMSMLIWASPNIYPEVALHRVLEQNQKLGRGIRRIADADAAPVLRHDERPGGGIPTVSNLTSSAPVVPLTSSYQSCSKYSVQFRELRYHCRLGRGGAICQDISRPPPLFV